jgi:prepilin-type N-terminal cleavage/methylation domain-containing protein
LLYDIKKQTAMKANIDQRRGFTLVEIMIVVAIIALLATIAIPNFVKARDRAQTNSCIANLKELTAAAQQWALETRQLAGATASVSVLWQSDGSGYILGSSAPVCPASGAAYPDWQVGDNAACPSVATHAL